MIETMVWIAVFIAAILATVSSLLYFYRANSYAIEQVTATASAQRGLEQTMRTIREAAYSSEGAFPIVSIAENDFIFYADIDDDPFIERVHYYIEGSNLVRGSLDPSGNPPIYSGTEETAVVAEHVRNSTQGISTFRYYDEIGSEITNYENWTSVRFIKVTLGVNVNENALPNQQTLDSSAAIRNLIGK